MPDVCDHSAPACSIGWILWRPPPAWVLGDQSLPGKFNRLAGFLQALLVPQQGRLKVAVNEFETNERMAGFRNRGDGRLRQLGGITG